jgi:hypothetical protein
MRPKFSIRRPRRLHAAAGALVLVAPSTAVALTTGAADAQSASGVRSLSIAVRQQPSPFGRSLGVTGAGPAASAGDGVALEYAAGSRGPWQEVAVATVGRGGRFALRAQLQSSGTVRVVERVARSAGAAAGWGPGSPAAAVSSPAPVTVGSQLTVSTQSMQTLAGQSATVSGTLSPGVAGRVVALQAPVGRSFKTIATARTSAGGRFVLRYTPASTGVEHVRVGFAGDRLNAGLVTPLLPLDVFRYSVASWYNDGGNTACGFHAGLGVASKTLPCGTKVAFRYGGRTVVATVDDRGPYVAGRDYDLNQNTAAALGVGGVATVESSI